MIEVIVTMCLIGTTLDVDPAKLLTHVETRQSCRAATKTFMEDPSLITPYTCLLNAQKYAVEWLVRHPGYQVRAIGCQPVRERTQEV